VALAPPWEPLKNTRSKEDLEDAMRIGVIGSGMIGSTLAELWVKAGHDVRLSSRHPNELKALADELGPGATAGTPADAAQFGPVVLLAVPVKAIREIAADVGEALRGKFVLDAGNASERRDGVAAREAARHPGGSAAWAASQFPETRWVKAFNTVYFKLLASQAHRQGDRIGIPLASDDAEALALAAQLARDAGFDPVVVGGLERGKEFEPGTGPYNTGMSGPDLRKLLSATGGFNEYAHS
jgi:8-hydroxy-5-deazaflavin:NADPH oxidoreductase